MKKLTNALLLCAAFIITAVSATACTPTEQEPPKTSETQQSSKQPEPPEEPTAEPMSMEFAGYLKDGCYLYSYIVTVEGDDSIIAVAGKDGMYSNTVQIGSAGGRIVLKDGVATGINLDTGEAFDNPAEFLPTVPDYSALAYIDSETQGEKTTERYFCALAGAPAEFRFIFENGVLTSIFPPNEPQAYPLIEFTGDPPDKLFDIPGAKEPPAATPGADADALFKEALEYYQAEEDDKALPLFKMLAEAGHADAQSYLATCYEYGYGVERDLNAAFEWYTSSADLGSPRGQSILGDWYRTGYGVDLSYETAFKLYQTATASGYARAMCDLGYMYENGYGVEQNGLAAVQWYKRAADLGYARAQYNLGLMYFYGGVVKQDKERAKELFQLAADQGYENARKILEAEY